MNGAALSALAGAATVVVLAIGCGGSGEGSSSAADPGSKPLTKAEYVREATVICGRERQRISGELEPLLSKFEEGNGSFDLARQAMKEVVLPGFRAEYEGIRALPPPWKDADFLDLMLLKFSRSIEAGEENLMKLFHVKASTYSEFAEGTLMTKEYGIKGCGSLRRSPEAVLEDF